MASFLRKPIEFTESNSIENLAYTHLYSCFWKPSYCYKHSLFYGEVIAKYGQISNHYSKRQSTEQYCHALS